MKKVIPLFISIALMTISTTTAYAYTQSKSEGKSQTEILISPKLNWSGNKIKVSASVDTDELVAKYNYTTSKGVKGVKAYFFSKEEIKAGYALFAIPGGKSSSVKAQLLTEFNSSEFSTLTSK